MKKRELKNLKLSKQFVSKLTSLKGGYIPAATCESPCQGGTDCCEPGSMRACTYDPESNSWIDKICMCPITVD
ncbi:hypothetical protein KORDIASMS9_04545 [Kordia sp. SMS9]|uniref:hypothetical protein n=1 Tax=Kordia sp. SMS9 TaxID=2282170 RepID=UPI000E0D6FA4|nr:hypothetical protein [Kordia sp. SMS9]AXG72276.1 hypothetical protein KORDIASMS9_04545 [Kordia sp. SMS9]